MKLIEADKVEQAIKDYWKAQVDKALTLTDGNKKRITIYLEHNHELLKAIDELPSVEAPDINVGNMDTILRQQAIDALDKRFDNVPMEQTAEILGLRKDLRELPSVQPTLYGYNIEHLELIARVLRKEDLPPERVAEALTDISRIVAIVRDEFEEALRKAVEQCTI